ncbi:hypothetical protein [Streptomyces sp. NPDC051662]|uniref:hypothetical protein n=1 Tax=Streptomyces sp. NPDC051662 TaxID=3154750 RepID=UPI0034222214
MATKVLIKATPSAEPSCCETLLSAPAVPASRGSTPICPTATATANHDLGGDDDAQSHPPSLVVRIAWNRRLRCVGFRDD